MFKLLSKKNQQAGEKLWSKSSEFDESWKKRISLMASYLQPEGVVADLGCGMMWLEQYLGVGHGYLPVDYVRRDDRTLVIDFNAGPLPDLKADVAFLSGSLEYVRDVPAFVRRLVELNFSQVVLSYCTLEKCPDLRARAALNWVSNESIFNMLALFSGHYDLTAIDSSHGTNTILVFKRKESCR